MLATYYVPNFDHLVALSNQNGMENPPVVHSEVPSTCLMVLWDLVPDPMNCSTYHATTEGAILELGVRSQSYSFYLPGQREPKILITPASWVCAGLVLGLTIS